VHNGAANLETAGNAEWFYIQYSSQFFKNLCMG